MKALSGLKICLLEHIRRVNTSAELGMKAQFHHSLQPRLEPFEQLGQRLFAFPVQSVDQFFLSVIGHRCLRMADL